MLPLPDLEARATSAAGDLDKAVALARELGTELPVPGIGRTRERWSALATLGAIDLTVARVAEQHLDALAILAESGHPDYAGHAHTAALWGVYAATDGASDLRARPAPGLDGRTPNGWRLDGTQPRSTLADVVDVALVSAWTDEEGRGLFAVPLRQPTVDVEPVAWVAHGLRAVRSTPTTYRSAGATLVGAPDWYLERDGRAWGGIGAAAAWLGGAVGLARRLRRQASEGEPDQLDWVHLGTVDAALHAAWTVLLASADDIDEGRARAQQGVVLALRVRQVVADAVETTLGVADHALGAAPLTVEEEHATRVSDLRVYLRDHHAERDAAALGRAAASGAEQPW